MKIKDIKEAYKDYRRSGLEKNRFVVYDYNDGNGKIVIIVNHHPNKDVGDYVMQVIRVSDGAKLMSDDHCRPCDDLDDAIDVAGEMMFDQG